MSNINLCIDISVWYNNLAGHVNPSNSKIEFWLKWRHFSIMASEITDNPTIVIWRVQVKSLRPRQNGRLFADDTFKRILLNENIRLSTKNSLKFVPKGPINNIPALFQIMAWRRPGDKPLSEPMLVCLQTHICVTRPQWSWVNSKVNIKTRIPALYDRNVRWILLMRGQWGGHIFHIKTCHQVTTMAFHVRASHYNGPS